MRPDRPDSNCLENNTTRSDQTDNLYQTVINNLYDGVYYVDHSKRIILWNKGAEQITGYDSQTVLNTCCSDNLLRHINDKGVELCIKGCPLARTLKDGKFRHSSVYLHHKNGHRVPVSVRVSPVFDKNNKIIGAVEIFTDNSKDIDLIKELETLRNENLTDALTQVGNRKFAEYQLKKRIEDLKTYNVAFGFLFFDIDHFKQINDTYGHDVGDAALKMVAKTVFNMIRALDSVCRWGGDEFVVILPNVNQKELQTIAEKIRLFVEKTWLQAAGTIIRTTLSMGGTMARSSDTISSLVKRADKLMYHSKKQGRNQFHIE
jgi:diguanylate cyclase (GGDEF)-like protein/PAS domain S-box-containing protein